MNNNRNISTFSPFITFCQHVIPLAYDESMSYYETLCALRDYLVNTVISAINNNANAVTELQDKYTEFTNNINKTINDLESYIDNYFNNLDVQTEINNKLDEMAESGELTDIIAQYLEIASILAFNTRENLKNATNLNEGSFTYCYGKLTYNDGYPAFYKIRKLVNTDEIDDENLIALTNYPELVAEKMPNKIYDDNFTNINNSINAINTEIDGINEKFDKKDILLVIGDSWSSTDSASVSARDNADTWVTKFSESLPELNVINLSYGASGFCKTGSDGKTFVTQYTDWVSENQDKLNDVKYIIIYGGINDIDGSFNDGQIGTALQNLATSIKTNTPNAITHLIYYNHVNRLYTVTNTSTLLYVANVANNNNIIFHKSITWLFGAGNECFASDDYHPNQKGCDRICLFMLNVLKGSNGISIPVTFSNLTFDNGSTTGAVDVSVTKNQLYFNPFTGLISGNFYFGVGNMTWTTVDGNISPKWRIDTNIGFITETDYIFNVNYAATTGETIFLNTYYNQSGKLWINGYNTSTSQCVISGFNISCSNYLM